MSKRPKITSRREKAQERRIQKARKQRDSGMKKAALKTVAREKPEPYILSHGRGPLGSDENLSPAEAPAEAPAKASTKASTKAPAKVRAWIETESAAQLRHYRRISREQEELTPLRRQWAKEFFERITGPRGFSVHAGTRRTIPKKDIPKRPRRLWRVVW